MTPYERGAASARRGEAGPPIPKGDATWAERLFNRGWCDTRDAIKAERERCAELLTLRADAIDKIADDKFQMCQPWKAERFAAKCLRSERDAIRQEPSPSPTQIAPPCQDCVGFGCGDAVDEAMGEPLCKACGGTGCAPHAIQKELT